MITDLEYKSTKKIVKDIYIASNDYKYFSSPKSNIIKAAVIDQNQALFARLRYFIFYFMTIELHKLFNSNEDFNIRKFLNYNNYQFQGDINDSKKKSIMSLQSSFKQKEIAIIITKISNLRNQFFAHLDDLRRFDESTILSFQELDLLLNKIIECLSVINPIIENSPLDFELNANIFQYNLYKHFEKYVIK